MKKKNNIPTEFDNLLGNIGYNNPEEGGGITDIDEMIQENQPDVEEIIKNEPPVNNPEDGNNSGSDDPNAHEDTTEIPEHIDNQVQQTEVPPVEEPETKDTTTEDPTEETTEAPSVETTTEAPTGETESQAPVNPYDDWVNTDRNLALLGEASDTGVHREGNVAALNDGEVFSWDGRDGITTADTPGSFDIALDKAYDAASIDQVAVYWRAADANFYPSF